MRIKEEETRLTLHEHDDDDDDYEDEEIIKYSKITSPKRLNHVVSISKFCFWKSEKKIGSVEMNFITVIHVLRENVELNCRW